MEGLNVNPKLDNLIEIIKIRKCNQFIKVKRPLHFLAIEIIKSLSIDVHC